MPRADRRGSFVISIESFKPLGGGQADKRYQQTFANPRGSFTVRGLKAGSYVFRVRLPRGKEVTTEPVTIKRGERRTGVRISAR